MTDYSFDVEIVVDPDNPMNVVQNGTVFLYDQSDEAGVSPIAIKDPSGLPMSNPLTSNAVGALNPFVATIPKVKWKSGIYEGFFYSYDGLRNEAVAARQAADSAAALASTAAIEAEAAAASAASSAALVNAPADAAVQTLVGDSGSATRGALDGIYAKLTGTPINVKDHGAKGDGATDDTAAINAALAAAAEGVLWFPNGTYIVSTLSIGADVAFGGDPGAVIKQKSGTNNFFISLTAANVTFQVSNITIDQNKAGQTTGSGKFLFNTTQAGITAEFRNVTFKDFCEGALRIVGDRVSTTREILRVFNCKFRGGTESTSGTYNTFTIFAADASELIVCDSDFDHGLTIVAQGIPAITVAATVVDSPDYTEVTIRNNRFKGYGRFTVGSGIGVIDSYAWATRMEITGNKFVNSRVTPIRGKVNARDGVISGNIMTDFISVGAGFGNGISLVSATVEPVGGNFEISSNVIHGVPENGIDVSHASGTVKNINIHDNIIDTPGVVGISVIRAENFNIHDNIIKSAGAQGITMNSCAGRGRVTSNTISGATLAGIQTIADQSTLDLVILNNFVDASTASGITAENLRSLALQGNTVKDVVDGGASGQRGYRIGGTPGIVTGQIKNNTAIGAFITGAYTLIGAGIATAFEEGNSWNFQKGYANAAPIAGTYVRGSVVWNTTPVAGGVVGWVCITAGSPGTWKSFGAIAA